jgi:hypothetical protein
MNRVTTLLVLALIVTTCGKSQPSAPTAPTATALSPTSSISAVTTGSNTLSGVVSDTSRGAPMAGVSVNAWIDQGAFGYSYWWAHGPVATDAAGRYQLSGLPDSATAWVQAWKDDRSEYVQQCAAPMVTLHGNMKADIQLVSRANLSASSSSVPAPAPGTRFVSGVIFESTVAGRQPVAGAFVAFEPVEDIGTIAADTVSDAAGRYLLCGLPEGRTVIVGGCLQPCDSFSEVSVPPGQTTGADIEITASGAETQNRKRTRR